MTFAPGDRVQGINSKEFATVIAPDPNWPADIWVRYDGSVLAESVHASDLALVEKAPVVRITLVKREWTSQRNNKTIPARTEVKEFTDAAEASDWFRHDSYFDESYTVSATWERLDAEEGEHDA